MLVIFSYPQLPAELAREARFPMDKAWEMEVLPMEARAIISIIIAWPARRRGARWAEMSYVLMNERGGWVGVVTIASLIDSYNDNTWSHTTATLLKPSGSQHRDAYLERQMASVYKGNETGRYNKKQSTKALPCGSPGRRTAFRRNTSVRTEGGGKGLHSTRGPFMVSSKRLSSSD